MKNILFSIYIFLCFISITAQTTIPVPPDIEQLSCINFYNQFGVSGGFHINFNDTTISPPPTEGKIIYTSNGFNWELASIPTNITSIENIQLIDDQLGYATGSRHDTAVFLRTTDGGVSWNNYGDLNYHKSINSQFFVNNLIGFLAVDDNGNAGILKTSQGGSTWIKIFSITDSSKINKIVFGNSSVGFALGNIGDTCILLKTTDGGESWLRNIASTTEHIIDITYSDSLTYYFITPEYPYSKIDKTTDAGISWSGTNVTTYTGLMVTKINFLPGGNVGFILWDILAVGYFESTDRGNSWSAPFSFGPDYSIYGSCMALGNKWFLTTGSLHGASILLVDEDVPVELTSFNASLDLSNVLLKWTTVTEKNNKGFIVQRKSNNGDWKELGFITGNGTSTEFHSYNFSDNLSESGQYSYRLKQVDYDGKIVYSKEEVVNFNPPDKYSLEQNYPNPFNPATVISYSLPSASNVKLIVYNTLGQAIKVLENEYKHAGNYTFNFNASSIPSGIYFYTIQTNSNDGKQNFTSTKKMILLK